MSDRARTLRRVGIVAAGAIILAGAAITTAVLRNDGPPERAPAPDVNDSSSRRIRVQVLNATTTRGLARRVTMLLRDRGFDVVAVGTSRAQQDSVVVIDRSGHPEWARRVAYAMGGARIESRPDTSRYLDVTVVLGASWRAPAEPFHP